MKVAVICPSIFICLLRNPCWFCTTVITQDHSRSTPYLDLIEREMDLMREHPNP